MGTMILLDLMGGVALLLWGLHMVQSGILRAFGPELRRSLSTALQNRLAAFAAGLGLTALLQSSTATALMAASFVNEGAVTLVPALAIMLGANVGTTLIVQVLSFNVSAVAPVLFVLGLVAFRSGGRSRLKDMGRVAIGLGLMLLALHILLDTLAPAEDAPSMRALLKLITGDPVFCVLIAAALTWAAHSSVATVLLTMSLAFSHFVTPSAALALVLGANLGSAINPILEGAHRGDPASYRLPLGNLINRLLGVCIALPFLQQVADMAQRFEPNMARLTAEFHVGFNIVLAIVFLPLLDPLASLLTKLLPDRKTAIDPSAPRYLDEAALDTPSLALANAAHESLHMTHGRSDAQERHDPFSHRIPPRLTVAPSRNSALSLGAVRHQKTTTAMAARANNATASGMPLAEPLRSVCIADLERDGSYSPLLDFAPKLPNSRHKSSINLTRSFKSACPASCKWAFAKVSNWACISGLDSDCARA
jgi:phosphate:Na+ symporter